MDRCVDGGREGQTGGARGWVDGGMAALARRRLCAWLDRWMDRGRGGPEGPCLLPEGPCLLPQSPENRDKGRTVVR